MTDQLHAALTLMHNFYTDERNPRFRMPNGKLVMPDKAPPHLLQERRDALLGKNFKFETPLLPKGAILVDGEKI